MRLTHFVTTLRHKWYVLIAGWRLRVPLWRLLLHDLSKWSPAEFDAYARQFHGDRSDSDGFALAWLDHQNRNDHHWEHWISRSAHGKGGEGGPLPIPEVAVREMVADWFAAGKVYAGSWPDPHNFTWFWQNKDKMKMHPQTWARLLVVLDETAQLKW